MKLPFIAAVKYACRQCLHCQLMRSSKGYFVAGNLGSAGHNGLFTLTKENQLEYVQGSHSAALKEALWDNIANFIVNGKVDKSMLSYQTAKRCSIVTVLGLLAPLIFLIMMLFGLPA